MKVERKDTWSQLSCNKATHCQEAEGEMLIQVIMPRLQRKSAERQAGARMAPLRPGLQGVQGRGGPEPAKKAAELARVVIQYRIGCVAIDTRERGPIQAMIAEWYVTVRKQPRKTTSPSSEDIIRGGTYQIVIDHFVMVSEATICG